MRARMTSRTLGVSVISILVGFLATAHFSYASTLGGQAAAEVCPQLYQSGQTSDLLDASQESAEYSPAGFITYHLHLINPSADGTPLYLTLRYFTDHCEPIDTYSPDPYYETRHATLPAGVSDVSIRFASTTGFEIWDDTHSSMLLHDDSGERVPPYGNAYPILSRDPHTTSRYYFGHTYRVNENAPPPIAQNTVQKPAACPDKDEVGGYLPFDFGYERAEYVGGYLRVHLRFENNYYPNAVYQNNPSFDAAVVSAGDSGCAHYDAINYSLTGIASPDHVWYFSYRFDSPTHWVLWDDEHGRSFDSESGAPFFDRCNGGCQGTLPATAKYAYFFARQYQFFSGGQVWYRSTPFSPVEPPHGLGNVLFLPGIESSRLYRTGDNRIWEPPLFGHDNSQLAMTNSGTSVYPDIYTKDTLDSVFGTDIYGSFLATMNQFAHDNDLTFEAYPYDWRYAADTIVSSPTHLQLSTIQLVDEVKQLAVQSHTGKITIIAHSNGGLVAKALMLALGADAPKYVDRLIFVAVPQVGTPQSIAGLLHGYHEALPSEWAQGMITDAEARSLGRNMPFAYGLLPSAAYFTSVATPVVSFDASTGWQNIYGSTITSKSALDNFLTDNVNRTEPVDSDLNDPEILHLPLLTAANTLHQSLDAWTPPAGVNLIQIAGWGIPDTVAGLTYRKNFFGSLTEDPAFIIDGDGTVVAPSALWTSTTAGARNYWFDLNAYNETQVTNFTAKDHARILAITELTSFIQDLVSNSLRQLSVYNYISTESPPSTQPRLSYSLHSPLTLALYDDQGHHTGVNSSGQIEEQIPGTYYTQFGDVKYLFVNSNSTLHIVMTGYATSTFTFEADELLGDNLIATTTWKNMPTTPNTLVTIDTAMNPTQNSLNIDTNGDSVPDFIVPPVPNGITTTLYKWNGFLQPINDTAYQAGQTPSVFKAGSTVPVKFQLKNSAGAVMQSFSAPVWLTAQRQGPLSAATNETVTTTIATAGTTYKWDAAGQQYIYNWNTKGLAAGYWYKVYAQLDDGNTYSVVVGLR